MNVSETSLPLDSGAAAHIEAAQAVAPPAQFSALYAFGDSLSDAGNDYIASFGVLPVSPPYSHGRYTNGPVWVQDLAKLLGLHTPEPSLAGGTDYAYGGAETGQTPLHSVVPIDLPSQLAQFAVTMGHAPSGALYTLTIGANDVIDALPTYAVNPAAAIADVQDAVSNEINFIGGLAALGAHDFLVMNVPDLGVTPEQRGDAANATTLSAIYDKDLQSALGSLSALDHLNIQLLDAFTLIDQVVANPAGFGFTNVTKPLWTGNYYNPFSGTYTAHGHQAAGYLFFDHLHPTALGHLELAQVASKLV